MSKADFPRLSKELVAQFAAMPTTNISDALDRLTIKGGCEGIRPLQFGMKMCGPAFTVRYIPVKLGTAGVGDYIDDVQTGGCHRHR